MDQNAQGPAAPIWVRRFDRFDRSLHILLMASFLGLSLTGVPLLFSERPWAATLSRLFGGFRSAATLHRVFATGMLVCFGSHLARLSKRLFGDKEYGILWGPSSLVPQPRDLTDLVQHVRWFLGRGERPRFERFTYWEKFDYWAVFWGMGIIGGSGLILWAPKFWARFLPGDLFNVALLVHGEEALLAVVFIFTGVLPLEELKHERPAEYDRLVEEGGVERLASPAPTADRIRKSRIVGTVAVSLGLLLVALTLIALLS